MTVKWIVTTLLYVQMMFCLLHNSDDGVTIQFNANLGNNCWSLEGRFAVFFGLSIGQCVQECGLRKHCKAINFQCRSSVCELFSSNGSADVYRGECSYVLSEDIIVTKTPCNDCTYGEVCDTTTRQCIYKECVSPEPLNHGKILGNLRNVGSKIRFKCEDGYRLRNGTSSAECTASGNWTAAAECTKDCDQPADITHGLVYAPVTTNGATAIYTCDVEYQVTAGDPVRTCTDGVWIGTIPVCSPIPNVGCYFAGQSHLFVGTRRTTIKGLPCQRWDSQTPHTHHWTSPEMYPSGDLSANENFCRDPDKYGKIWCYTTDPDVRWELCGIPLC